MLGFSPLASLPLGDEAFEESIGLTLTGITAGSPTLQNTTISTTYNFTLIDITTQASVGITSLEVNYNLVPFGITAQNPTLAPSALVLSTPLTLITITGGIPTLGTALLSGNQSLSTAGITTGTPSLQEATFILLYPLLGDDVTTNKPTLGSSSLVSVQALEPTAVNLGTPAVGTLILSQEHLLIPTTFSSGVVSFTQPLAFNQPPFDPNYNKQRVAFIVSENRSVIVPFTPRKVTQEVKLQNRTTRI